MDNVLRLFDLIGELARRRYQVAERGFAVLGLNHTEARLLTLLDREGGAATQEALANLIFIDRSNVGRALKQLERTGRIERRKDDADKRTNLVQITAEGRAAIVDIERIRSAMAHRFFGELTNDEAASIVAMLSIALAEDDHA